MFIGSSSFLQVTRPRTIIFRMGLKFSQIRPRIAELAALERLEKSHRVIMATLAPLIFVIAGNEDMHKSLNAFEFTPDPKTDSIVSIP